MKVLLTGANGYIGRRLLPLLVEAGHEVVCCVRNRKRLPQDDVYGHPRVTIHEVDFLAPPRLDASLGTVDAAYYLIHSMADKSTDFDRLEELSARHFLELASHVGARQIVYLGGISNSASLSRHLASRKNVEDILRSGPIPVTSLRAGIIVGSGSASFEIMRDLVEKLPVMVAPRWLNTRTQPIAIRNVLDYLVGVLMNEATFGESYDIGGPDVLTYKEMLQQFGEVRGLKRRILVVPVLTPRLSSYWLYFVTSTSYRLAVNLVDSMMVEVVARRNDLDALVPIRRIPYRDAVAMAFEKIEFNAVVSSWKDSLSSSYSVDTLLEHADIPTSGCFVDRRLVPIEGDRQEVIDRIWSIGGRTGWYYGDRLWRIRGVLDKLFGGVGLRRGRTNASRVSAGDALDFWRVLVADRAANRLLLYAEMKLPGEAWLEFRIVEREGGPCLQQTATFRPKGVLGRLYWYAVLPFHFFVFEGMARNIARYAGCVEPPGVNRRPP